MIITEIFNGFKIAFDDKLSITITLQEAQRILDFLQEQKDSGNLEQKSKNKMLAPFYDCGEY